MKIQTEITEATRNLFIQVFCDFYKNKPIEKITVKEIAEKAGYSRATFYNYFKDPYDLMQFIEDEFITHIINSIKLNVSSDNFFENFINNFSLALSSKNTHEFLLFTNPYNTSFINRFKAKIIPVLMEILNIPQNDKSAIYVLEFYIPGIISIFSRWSQNKNEFSTDELANLIKTILDEGILTSLKKIEH